MAQQRSHLTVSTVCAIAYAGLGAVLWHIGIDLVLLAGILVVVSGLLPNVDGGPNSDPGKKFIGFLGALAPLIIISAFPARLHHPLFFACMEIRMDWFLSHNFISSPLYTVSFLME